MAVKIRLKRMGANKKPFYRVVVADGRSPRDGRFIDELGYYNPLKEPAEVKIDSEKAEKWLNNGAQPTETVKRLFSNVGIAKSAAPKAAIAADDAEDKKEVVNASEEPTE